MSERPRRLGGLVGMPVLIASGEQIGKVTDVRVTAPAGTAGYAAVTVSGFVVSPRATGSLLGYDRRPQQGPLLVRAVVRLLHRHAGYAAWEDVDEVDWAEGVLRLRVDRLRTLEAP